MIVVAALNAKMLGTVELLSCVSYGTTEKEHVMQENIIFDKFSQTGTFFYCVLTCKERKLIGQCTHML